MDAFTELKAIVIPLDRANVDTDAIIPKQFLKAISRTGFGPYLFDEWRYLDHGEPGMDCTDRPRNESFVLNQERYQGGQILLARDNFGCGSSREHAPWALLDFGIRCVIAPSYADIFYNNCFKNGILPIVLDEQQVSRLFSQLESQPGFQLHIDLATQSISTSGGEVISFEIDNFRKECLLKGMDEIGLTLKHADEIRAYEEKRKGEAPWLFSVK